VNAQVMPEHLGPFGKDLVEVRRPIGDGKRVEVTVVDPNWLIDGKPRIVRRIAHRPCMCCRRSFLSPDTAKVRMCETCKGTPMDKSSYG
jgi:hypothetical protein